MPEGSESAESSGKPLLASTPRTANMHNATSKCINPSQPDDALLAHAQWAGPFPKNSQMVDIAISTYATIIRLCAVGFLPYHRAERCGNSRSRVKYLNNKSGARQEIFKYSSHDFHKSTILPSSAISYLIVSLLASMSLLMCVRITRFAPISGKCFSKVLRFM